MNIRNFAIIAHIDNGKSTLADRMLEKTGTVKVGSGNQLLDTMDLEKEKGITIKLNPARMRYRYNGSDYQINLIDTPGHVDFGYEVSRSLNAVEGVVLLVDASQGVQAQTLTNLAIAQQLNLAIIPVVNKIDLPTAEPESTAEELMKLTGCAYEDICFISGKTGEGVEDLLEKIVTKIPAPNGDDSEPIQALVFDSFFDKYLGVVAYIKVFNGKIKQNDTLTLKATKVQFDVLQTGFMQISRVPVGDLGAGEIGYVATGLKSVQECRVGDTIVFENSTPPLPGYQTPKPMIFASFFPEPGMERELTASLDKLKLNDASLVFEPVHSQALGPGYNVGFLGLLHLEIIKERLLREFDMNVLVTTPTVAFKQVNGVWLEPWVNLEIVTPQTYYGAVTDLVAKNRAVFESVEYVGERVVCKFIAPLTEIIIDFYDSLKSVTSGFASMDYQFLDYREADLVAVDLLIAGEKMDALTQYMVREKADRYARNVVVKLKELIPRQNFEISIQAAIGGKILARADISAFRKDVTSKLYGGDVTRKNKLLDKQKKGKKRMRNIGKLEVPSEVFVELLKK
ncbi:elongation factor 4 [Candidatus Berkelbacteria bacterium]|nr:elongation factor 4 [Candidatus Berkelbacteria bacterium]